METAAEVIIRKYQPADRQEVRRIAFDTSFVGDPGDKFFDDKEILADFLTKYYLDYEPESCFVAESSKRVIGYLIGSKDTLASEKISKSKILPKLLFKAFARNIFFKKKTATFIFNCLVSFFKKELSAPDFSREYPATLHINLEEGFRSQGIGAKLIAAYLDYLAKEKIKGVHFATLSERAARFYEKLGFVLLFKKERSYFRNILHKNITCYIYGKKLHKA